jgi:hypothetical protein
MLDRKLDNITNGILVHRDNTIVTMQWGDKKRENGGKGSHLILESVKLKRWKK